MQQGQFKGVFEEKNRFSYYRCAINFLEATYSVYIILIVCILYL